MWFPFFCLSLLSMSKFKLRSGKHKDKTLDWVEENDPSYLVWVEEFRPEMLKEPKKGKKDEEEEAKPKTSYQQKKITPNLEFDNEPAWVLPAVKVIEEIVETKDIEDDEEWNF